MLLKSGKSLLRMEQFSGHEIVGEIVEINSKTDFKVGDRIVSSHHVPCFKCIYCKNENYSMCEHFKKRIFFREDLVNIFIFQKNIYRMLQLGFLTI